MAKKQSKKSKCKKIKDKKKREACLKKAGGGDVTGHWGVVGKELKRLIKAHESR